MLATGSSIAVSFLGRYEVIQLLKELGNDGSELPTAGPCHKAVESRPHTLNIYLLRST